MSLTDQRPDSAEEGDRGAPVDAFVVPIDGRLVPGVQVIEFQFVTTDDVIISQHDAASEYEN